MYTFLIFLYTKSKTCVQAVLLHIIHRRRATRLAHILFDPKARMEEGTGAKPNMERNPENHPKATWRMGPG